MKRKRHTPEQIVGHLREAEKLPSEDKTITQVIKKLGVTEQTYYLYGLLPLCKRKFRTA